LPYRRIVTIAAAVLVVLAVVMAPTGTAASGEDTTPPVFVNHLVVAGVTPTSVTLRWLAGTDDVGILGYDVLWNSRKPRDAERTLLPTFTKTGLSCGSSYVVTVTAVDAAGNVSSPPAEAVVATGACIDATPPSQPQGLTQVARTETTATLAWQGSTDNVGVAGYVVARDGVPLGNTSAATYTLTGLSCGAAYSAVVQAFDATGNRSAPSSYTGTTATCSDKTPPTAPTNLKLVSRTDTSISLAWSASSDASGIAGYTVYADGTKVATSSGTSATLDGLACGRSYTIGVEASDTKGNVSSRSSASMSTASCPPTGSNDTTPPTAPGVPKLVSQTATSLSISWNASTDASGVAGYAVYADGGKVATSSGTSATLGGLACGRSYTIGVEASDTKGNVSSRSSASMSTGSCPSTGSKDTTPPTAPANLALTSLSLGSASIKWSPSSDNVGVVGYTVYNGSTVAGDTTGTGYTVTAVDCGVTAQIGVEAKDAAGNRSQRTTLLAGTHPCADSTPPTVPGTLTLQNRTETSITVNWAASKDNIGVVGYGVYRDGQLLESVATNSYTFAGLACGKSFTLGVDAVDGSGLRSAASVSPIATLPCSDTIAPTTPTSLAVSAVSQTALTLTWKASTDTGGVLGYDVLVDGVKKATTTTLQSALGNLKCGTTMTLGVEAYDKSGNRSQRATTSATTSACTTSSTPSGGTLFVVPGGSDSAACTSSAPCASFDRAYQLAKPGQVVEIAGGTYGNQVIGSRAAMRNLSPGCEPGNTGNCVVFRPAAGATVTINGVLEGHGSSVWVDGSTSGGPPSDSRTYNIKVTGYADTEADSAMNYPDHVILEGIDATSFGAFNVDTVTLKDMDVGPATITGGCAIRQGRGMENKIGFGGGVTYVPRNVTIDGVLIHDQNGDSGRIDSDCHFGGLFIVTVDGLTIKNSVFSQNVVYNIQIQNFAGPPPTNVTIENNWFGCPVEWLYTSDTTCDNQPDVQFNASSSFSNYLIRYNSFAGGLGQMVGGASYSNVRVLGNAGSGPAACYPGWTFGYNAWDTSGCAPTDVNLGSLPFVNSKAGSENFTLQSTSKAVDLVTSSGSEYLVGSDLAGTARPLGAARDAGATETR
jgi:chitodextrinase